MGCDVDPVELPIAADVLKQKIESYALRARIEKARQSEHALLRERGRPEQLRREEKDRREIELVFSLVRKDRGEPFGAI